jgi:hypothetical protein
MRVVQRFSYNGTYMHQTVDGVGEDLEIQEYGLGEEAGKRGVFGVVHPSINNEKKTGLDKGVLVIHMGDKWVRATEEEWQCDVCRNWYTASKMNGNGMGFSRVPVCTTCEQKGN